MFVQAVVAAEDADYFKHGGVDYMGMARAFVTNVLRGRKAQGGSTITQQVVKNLLLTPERKFKRKVQEIILAHRLSEKLTKEEILALYLNQIYFGHGRYGCEEAARYYFGKSVKEIDLAEAALLAGLPQSPERLSPRKHPDAAKARQRYVLGQMADHGFIDRKTAERIAAQPIRLARETAAARGLAAEEVDVVAHFLADKLGENAAFEAGTTVATTLDARLQEMARTAVERGLEELDARQGYRGPSGHVDRQGARQPAPRAGPDLRQVPQGLRDRRGDRPALREGRDQPKPERRSASCSSTSARASRRMRRAPPPEPTGKGKLAQKLKAPPPPPLPPPTREGVRRLQPRAPLREGDEAARRPLQARRSGARAPRRRSPAQGGRAAAARARARARRRRWWSWIRRRARCWRWSAATTTTRAASTGRSARAASRGRRSSRSSTAPRSRPVGITPATILNDAPEVYDLWKPQNYEKEAFRGPVRVRTALAHSINTVAIKVLSDVGLDQARAFATRVGVTSPIAADIGLSLALGSLVMTPLELANVYATFASGGIVGQPVSIRALGGEPQPPAVLAPTLKPEVAYVMVSLMRSVVDEGTAHGAIAGKMRRPAAGKTGTSNGQRDAWFVGFTPDLLAAVWVGFDDMKKLGRGEAGGKTAAPIWADFMAKAMAGRPTKDFAQPPGIVVQRIDKASGLLAAPGQESGTLDEVFIDGTAPTEHAAAGGGEEASPDKLSDGVARPSKCSGGRRPTTIPSCSRARWPFITGG